MMDREKVIKELHDARRYLEDKEWSDRGASPHIDAINDALAMLKEQEATIKRQQDVINIMASEQYDDYPLCKDGERNDG